MHGLLDNRHLEEKLSGRFLARVLPRLAVANVFTFSSSDYAGTYCLQRDLRVVDKRAAFNQVKASMAISWAYPAVVDVDTPRRHNSPVEVTREMPPPQQNLSSS